MNEFPEGNGRPLGKLVSIIIEDSCPDCGLSMKKMEMTTSTLVGFSKSNLLGEIYQRCSEKVEAEMRSHRCE